MTIDKSTLTIQRKLTWGFGLILLILVGLTLAAVYEVRLIKQALDENSLRNSVIQRAAINFRGSAHDRAIAIRDVAAATTAAEVQAEMATIERLTQFYAQSGVVIEKMLAEDRTLPPEIARLNGAIKETESKALPLIRKVIELRQADQRDQAQTIVWTEAKPLFVEWLARINALIDFEETIIQKNLTTALSESNFFQSLMIGLTLLALLLGGACASVISASIRRDLGAEPYQVKAVADAVRGGDLTIHIETGNAHPSSVIVAMKAMRDSLVNVVQGVRTSASNVAITSAEIAQGNHELSARTESQASALEQTASSMEQLGSTVRQNADNARQANQLAVNASSVAIQGGEVVAQVVDTMKGINDSSRKIADIISVIDGIAFQTNILALNAAVEAARAGEQGRGFAVVASEVRSLAGRSAEAAREIKSLIGANVERLEHGTALVDRAGATMTEVVSSIRQVTDIMGEISAASSEQSSGVAQVGEAVTQMDQTTQQNASLVEEMAAAASGLKNQAEELVQAVSVFKLGNDSAYSATRSTPLTMRTNQPQQRAFKSPQRATIAARPAAPSNAGASVQARLPATSKAKTPVNNEDDWTSF
ncbi:MAG: methyl-accepting chemotaxis protein [Rhodoferax sp.]|nr:methyl-accepting chemotaxis protein [Rhodoferax sp.]